MSTSEFERLVNLRAWSNAVVNQPREEGRDRRVVAGAIGLYQRCTDALRGTGGACQQRSMHIKPKRLGGLEVDHQLIFGRTLALLRPRHERPRRSRAAERR